MPLYPTTNRLSQGALFYEGNGLTPIPYEASRYESNSANSLIVRPSDGSNRSPTSVYFNQEGSIVQPQVQMQPQEPLNPNHFYTNTKYHNIPPVEYHYNKPILDQHQNEREYTRIPMKSVDLSNNQVKPLQPIYHDYSYFPPLNQYRAKLLEKPLSYEDSLIRDRYPRNFAIVHSIIMIILSLTVIVLQIVMIIYQSPYYFIGGGIWSGAYFILCASLAIVLGKFQN